MQPFGFSPNYQFMQGQMEHPGLGLVQSLQNSISQQQAAEANARALAAQQIWQRQQEELRRAQAAADAAQQTQMAVEPERASAEDPGSPTEQRALELVKQTPEFQNWVKTGKKSPQYQMALRSAIRQAVAEDVAAKYPNPPSEVERLFPSSMDSNPDVIRGAEMRMANESADRAVGAYANAPQSALIQKQYDPSAGGSAITPEGQSALRLRALERSPEFTEMLAVNRSALDAASRGETPVLTESWMTQHSPGNAAKQAAREAIVKSRVRESQERRDAKHQEYLARARRIIKAKESGRSEDEVAMAEAAIAAQEARNRALRAAVARIEAQQSGPVDAMILGGPEAMKGMPQNQLFEVLHRHVNRPGSTESPDSDITNKLLGLLGLGDSQGTPTGGPMDLNKLLIVPGGEGETPKQATDEQALANTLAAAQTPEQFRLAVAELRKAGVVSRETEEVAAKISPQEWPYREAILRAWPAYKDPPGFNSFTNKSQAFRKAALTAGVPPEIVEGFLAARLSEDKAKSREQSERIKQWYPDSMGVY